MVRWTWLGALALGRQVGRDARPLCAASLLIVHAGLLAWSAYRHSPVLTEIGHLPAGLSHLQHGRFDLDRVNPPLVRMIAAVPVQAAGAVVDWRRYDPSPRRRSDLAVGEDFLRANGSRSFWFFTLGRWASATLSLVGGWVCYRWATELYGAWSGLVALGLWCFSPTILGHAALVMPDVGAAAMGAVASYTFWRWLRRPSWLQGLAAGVVLGLAELTKMTLLVLYLVLPTIWLVDRWVERRRGGRPRWALEAATVAAMAAVSLLVINAGYNFEGSLQKLADYEFQSRLLSGEAPRPEGSAPWGNRFAAGPLAGLWVPLPRNYVQGIDAQKADFERTMRSYLRGKWRIGGWWYFYLYALAVKVPEGTWLLIGLALVAGVFGRGYVHSWRDELTVLLPAVTILVLVSWQTGLSIHPRYVLPAFGFLFVWASKVGRALTLPDRKMAYAVTVSFGSMLASSLYIYPHSLSYFNAPAGGPLLGHTHLVDSALAWGQDLMYLKRWLDRHPEARPLRLASFGHVDPRLAGIEFELPPMGPRSSGCNMGMSRQELGPQAGWYAIDVNYLVGSGRLVPDGMGGHRVFEPGGCDFQYFGRFVPVAHVGYSVRIYHVTLQEACKIRRRLGLEPPPTQVENAAVRRSLIAGAR